jgi:hypothetical protein
LSLKRYLPAANRIAQAFPDLLAGQDLDPCICCSFLAETEQGDVWLFVAMHESAIAHLDSYISARVLSRLSRAFHGHLVTFSQKDGLRYAVLLSPSRDFSQSSEPLEIPTDAAHLMM